MTGFTRDQAKVAVDLVSLQEIRQVSMAQLDPFAIVKDMERLVRRVDKHIGESGFGDDVAGVGEEIVGQTYGFGPDNFSRGWGNN